MINSSSVPEGKNIEGSPPFFSSLAEWTAACSLRFRISDISLILVQGGLRPTDDDDETSISGADLFKALITGLREPIRDLGPFKQWQAEVKEIEARIAETERKWYEKDGPKALAKRLQPLRQRKEELLRIKP